MIRVCHIITGLKTGGTEIFLSRLLREMIKGDTQHMVVSLTADEEVAKSLSEAGLQVLSLNLVGVRDIWSAMWRLLKLYKTYKPQVVQTWLYHSDIIGGLTARIAGKKVVWNIRQENLSREVNKRHTVHLGKIGALLSRLVPHRIICCSSAAARSHQKIGYAAHKMIIIPNGINTTVFRSDPTHRVITRKELKIGENQIVIGRIGRLDPQKDYKTFIESMALVQKQYKNIITVMCGEGIQADNELLEDWIRQVDDPSRFILLGKKDNMAALYQAMDIVVSSSVGEGFSNVIAEAMACEIPCVATDVSDTREIMGNTGMLVKTRDPKGMADACLHLIALGEIQRRAIGKAARKRIVERYGIERAATTYRNLYSAVLEGRTIPQNELEDNDTSAI